ncbi:MAG TPA: hypothetical protein PKI49_07795 [Pseudomonadota bacterium]|jgi:hypothetical protein|nr:hypothetical protein [Pseudomonadota bacterium]HND11519.1 hypothetical protein [Pseudomonadota bacterium]HNF99574.1 hypothetical protein [Pseudomonadota bacterium]HNI59135.1 hypothetical protein [Pseudomonadota bacterium]HNK46566.1 hypothetical protein [Pseudomonadota bacterium]
MRRNSSFRRLLAASLLALGVASCGGRPDNMVIVAVSGLLPRITELYVTMQLDDIAAKNSRPVPESGSDGFVVYQQMERFAVEVPDNTQRITIDIKGFDTARSVVRQGTGSLSLSQSHDLSIELVAP